MISQKQEYLHRLVRFNLYAYISLFNEDILLNRLNTVLIVEVQNYFNKVVHSVGLLSMVPFIVRHLTKRQTKVEQKENNLNIFVYLKSISALSIKSHTIFLLFPPRVDYFEKFCEISKVPMDLTIFHA